MSVLHLRQRLDLEKGESLIHHVWRSFSKFFELNYPNLLAGKKTKHPFDLLEIKPAVQIGRPAWLERQRFPNPVSLLGDGFKEPEGLLFRFPIHVPMRKGPVDRVAQQDDEFDPRMVVADSLHRRLPVGVDGSAGTDDERSSLKLYPFVQDVVIDLARKPLFIVEEMTARMIDHVRFLAVRHRDVGMLVQMIVQRARPAFLGPRDDEIQPLYRYGAKYFVSSTSECYGDPLEHPQKETYWGNVNPIGPRSVYDEAKRFTEAVTMAYHRYHKVDTRIVRIFNTYGPRMQLNDGRVVPNFMKQALRGEELTVYGDGSQTRSFCYVSDEIEGFLRLSRSDEHLPVNIGNPKEFTIMECAKLVLAITGSKSKIRYEPLPPDDPKQRCPDITKARTLLGWEPKIDLETGLRLSLDYFRKAAG